MNVLTLPDEMLAKIASYMGFETLKRMRKISSKIDSVSRRYNCNQTPVDSLHIDDRRNVLAVTLCGSQIGDEKWADISHLEEDLPKIKILKELDFRGANFDDKLFTTIKRHRKSFRVSDSITKEMAYSLFWKVCPRIVRLELWSDSPKAICNIEVLGNRKWEHVSITQSRDSVIDNELIMALVPNCDGFAMNRSKDITVLDVARLLKACIAKRGVYNQKINISEVVPGEMDLMSLDDEVRRIFEANIEGAQVIIRLPRRFYAIKFEQSTDGAEFHFFL